MPAVHSHVDDCQTAEQVRARAIEVQRRRASMRNLPVTRLTATVKPPSTAPVESGNIKVTVHFGYPLIPIETYRAYRLRDIQKACCRAGGVEMTELVSPMRNVKFVRARHISMLLCKMLGAPGTSLPIIGRAHGGRDHTTVMAALERMQPVRDALDKRVADGTPLQGYVAAAFDAWDEFIAPLKKQFSAAAGERLRAANLGRK